MLQSGWTSINRKSLLDTEARMSFFEHLDELRKRITIIAIAYVIGIGISYPYLYELVMKAFLAPGGNPKLIITSPLEGFFVRFSISLFAAFIITSPITFYNILAFLSPALKRKERISLYFGVFAIVVLFMFGVWLGYNFILPVGLEWLLAQGGTLVTEMLKATEYVSVVSWFLISFGLAFQLPVIIVVLVKLGIMSEETLQKNWRIVYMVVLVAASVLTPDFSPVTMMMLALPMILLYHATVAYLYIPKIKKLLVLKRPFKKP